MRRGGSTFFFLILASALHAGAARGEIVVDGAFDDWSGVNPSVFDPAGDGGPSGIDFARVWVANDVERLLLRFECGTRLVAQSANGLVLYADTDDSVRTGAPIAGIGADLVWRFGSREGAFRGAPIRWPDVGLVVLPSHASDAFEVSIRRDASPAGARLFGAPRIRILLADAGLRGDRAPGGNRSIPYRFDDEAAAPSAEIPLGRTGPRAVRVLSYNVERDGPWRRPGEHGRLLRAIDPDVIAYQEIAGHGAQATRDWVRDQLPGTWSVAASGDRRTLARWPIRATWETGEGRATAALVGLPDTLGGDLLVLNVHLSCCDADLRRRRQADAIMEFVRDAREGGGAVTLPRGTGIVIAGDTNAYGEGDVIATLRDGEIFDEAEFGPDFAPDWDGSPLLAPLARHAGERESYTYRDPGGAFGPSLIDRVLYSGSALAWAGGYVLETNSLLPETRQAFGLAASDARIASDHLPLVADLAPRSDPALRPARPSQPLPVTIDPNPVTDAAAIHFVLGEPKRVTVELFDAAGRRSATLFSGALPAGPHAVVWRPDRALASGVYFGRVAAGARRGAFRALLLR